MVFSVDERVLQRLEWPAVASRLASFCRLPSTRRWLEETGLAQGGEETGPRPLPALFEDSAGGAEERLLETSEARALLDAEQFPPLEATEVEGVLRRAERGGVLEPGELQTVFTCARTLRETLNFLDAHQQLAPRLHSLAASMQAETAIEEQVARCIDPSGEVSDRASRELARARSQSNQLAKALKKKLDRTLENPDVARYLTDSFVTVRNDRYVLPVRADARNRVPGIVHDASNSGTTLFVEPQEVVDLNNQLKEAELAVGREVYRILRDLSDRVASAVERLRPSLKTLSRIDWAFARGHLSKAMEAVEPQIDQNGSFELNQLRHPLLDPQDCIPNDIRLGESYHVLVLSGPNAGGKTVAMKSVALAALFARAGLHVPAEPGARIPLVDRVLADIGDEQDIRENLSTFSAHMGNLAEIVRCASSASLVVLDEIGVGTDPGEGAALGQAILESLAERGVRVIATTHYNLLKEMADIDERFCNASVEFDPDTLEPTYRLRFDIPGSSSARTVAARMGMPQAVIERADGLLERDDRQLDRMLVELGASRAALDREQREVQALRTESEATRNEYRDRLERLQKRRDKLFQEMRTDLDRSFEQAHEQVRSVIRELQAGERAPSAQDAARAREELLAIDQSTPQREEAPERQETSADYRPVNWNRMKEGDRVVIPGGQAAVLESLPDSRGRVKVLAGSARIVVPAARVQQCLPGVSTASPRKNRHGNPASDEARGGTAPECDLRGLRVDEALAVVDRALDDAARTGSDCLKFIHGFGTGALREAVKHHLQNSPYVQRLGSGEPEEGGDGVTIAELSGVGE